MATNAIVAFLASRVERDDYFVANGKLGNLIPFLNDDTDKFMPTNKVCRALKMASVEVQVRSLFFMRGQVGRWKIRGYP